MWFGHKPNLSHRVLSATGYCHIAQENMRKLYPHARKGTLVGYGVSTGVQAYNLFNLKTRKILFSQSVTFDEEGLLLNLPTMVQYSHQNINTNLLTPLDILHRESVKALLLENECENLMKTEQFKVKQHIIIIEFHFEFWPHSIRNILYFN
mgnify:CR=1 FL=1